MRHTFVVTFSVKEVDDANWYLWYFLHNCCKELAGQIFFSNNSLFLQLLLHKSSKLGQT